MAKRIVDMDALTHAVEEFGREVRELSAMNLATSSDVLVVLAGESMRGKSDRRSAFAEDVERAIREVGQVPGSGVTADPSLYALSAMKVSATTSLSVSGRTRMRERARTSSPR